MTLPLGYSVGQGELPPSVICYLHKSIYGLIQASRQWFHKFSIALIQKGYDRPECDHAIFIKSLGNIFIALIVYVDDIVIASNGNTTVEDIMKAPNSKFKMKDLRALQYFLGLEIAQSSAGISLCQRKYALDMLTEAGYIGCKPFTIPMEPNLNISQDDGECLDDPTSCRRLMEKLLYFTITKDKSLLLTHHIKSTFCCYEDQHFSMPCTFFTI